MNAVGNTKIIRRKLERTPRKIWKQDEQDKLYPWEHHLKIFQDVNSDWHLNTVMDTMEEKYHVVYDLTGLDLDEEDSGLPLLNSA